MDATEALAVWVAEGQIDSDLAERLRTSLAAHDEPQRTNKIIWVLVSIGAVLTGAGLLLFIASQWDQSSPVRRLALLFTIYLLVVGAAALADRQQLGVTAKGLWFLSSIAVGVNIFLVGQIYNLPLNYWQGTLLWLIATMAMGWASPSSAQGWLAVPLGLLTLGWISTPTSQFFEQGEFLFAPGGLRPLVPLVGLGLVATAMVVDATLFDWLKQPAAAFGAVLVAVPIVVSTFHPMAFAWIFQVDVRPFHVVVGLGAVALIVAAWLQDRSSPFGLAGAAVTGLLMALLPQVSDDDGLLDGDSLPWLAESFDNSKLLFGLYTAVIFGLAVATIMAGQYYAKPVLVNIGYAMVSVILFALYVGRIAGELPTSLAVIGGGLALISGAIFLERRRRGAISTMAPEGVQ
jgi:uncharacterized membrane protein